MVDMKMVQVSVSLIACGCSWALAMMNSIQVDSFRYVVCLWWNRDPNMMVSSRDDSPMQDSLGEGD